MDIEALKAVFAQLRETDVTKTLHNKLYPSIDPTRPENSQAGKVILIPGGGTGVGFGIAKSFVRASADTILLIGRRLAVLEQAKAKLEHEAESAGTSTKVITFNFDITDLSAINTFWGQLAEKGIFVDVFVNNVARFTDPKPLLELGAEDVWNQVEVSGRSPLYFAEKFYAQAGDKQKVSLTTFTFPLIVIPRHDTMLTRVTVHRQRLYSSHAHDGPSRCCRTSSLHLRQNDWNALIPAHRPKHPI